MLPMRPMSPILLSQKGQFVGSIENQMLPIGDQLEGKGFGLQLDSNEGVSEGWVGVTL